MLKPAFVVVAEVLFDKALLMYAVLFLSSANSSVFIVPDNEDPCSYNCLIAGLIEHMGGAYGGRTRKIFLVLPSPKLSRKINN